MARINTVLLVSQVVDGIARVDAVAQDPAVQKAGSEARVDIARAARSTGRLGQEIVAAYRRQAP